AVDHSPQVLSLAFLPSSQTPTGFHSAHRLDPSWMDLTQMKEWRKKCYSVPGDICNALSARKAILTARPRLLIDTWQMCIVRARIEEYVTLSYVWGVSDQLKTVAGNFEELLLPKSLQRHDSSAKIPRTIYDTIQRVNALDERFLRADSLYIFQDDELNKNGQINDMAV
ncbi:hypothetical protein B0J14DRAFT_96324, partial [Halenospora varia]